MKSINFMRCNAKSAMVNHLFRIIFQIILDIE